jgi:hypothetical protein
MQHAEEPRQPMQHAEEPRQPRKVTNLPRREETDKSYRLAERIIYYALGIVETVLGFSFALKALAANPISPFVQFVNAVAWPFAAPFQSIFGTSATGTGSVFEWSIVVGMLVYLVAAIGLVKLSRLIIKGGNPGTDESTM